MVDDDDDDDDDDDELVDKNGDEVVKGAEQDSLAGWPCPGADGTSLCIILWPSLLSSFSTIAVLNFPSSRVYSAEMRWTPSERADAVKHLNVILNNCA